MNVGIVSRALPECLPHYSIYSLAIFNHGFIRGITYLYTPIFPIDYISAIIKFALILTAGFHQKCHNPPIPSSALQLDITWNCAYCMKGSKCPYLTESLDVLQNLLSDDEQSQEVDRESTATIESDHFDEPGEETKPNPLRRRRVGNDRAWNK